MKAIAKKLVQVMSDCAYVQKSGTNDFHRYKYATAADVLEKVNASLVKHGVAVTAQAELIDLREVTTAKGNIERLATVRTTLTLVDTDTGETMVSSGIGSGQDPGDKASMKASTASLKYAWMTTLTMATGDDPEADAGVDQRMAEAPKSKLPEPPLACSECGANITAGVQKVSVMRFKRPLCMACQDKISRKTA
ncbi:MAG: single-stranded DNA-binding protein [Veillonellaceae bacterium]|nr:single-stranded DNA-binding protein [Veillonellaceae bacterium]